MRILRSVELPVGGERCLGGIGPDATRRAAVPRGQASRRMRGLAPLEPHAPGYDKPSCASLDGFTLHAATRAGALDLAGREALLRHVLRPVPPCEDVIDRVARLGSKAARVKEAMRDKLLAHRQYIRQHGDDMPEIRDWKWPY